MSSDLPSSYVVRNCLLFAYRSLRNTERLVNESLQSPYEILLRDVANALSPNKKLDMNIPNSEVEAFYNRRLSETDFMSNVQSKILSKVPASGPGMVVSTGTNFPSGATVVNSFNQFSLLFSVVWELVAQQNSAVCNKLPKHSGKQLWEVFLKLDTECELKVHVDDIVDLVILIFRANGHNEQEENVKEWFCGEAKIDFLSLFSQLTEKFVGLLQVHIVQEIHMNIVSEFLKEGRMEKKGHVVHNWKTRWFVLTASSLNYFESHDNLILKGSVVINGNSLVQNMQEFKARPYRFRVVCGDTKNGTEISAPSPRSMHEWIYTIRLAIKMHHVQGRNFLHKYRQALAIVPKPQSAVGLTKCVSEDRVSSPENGQASPHRKLNPSKSVPLEADSVSQTKGMPLPAVPEPSRPAGFSNPDYDDADSFNDAPPLPPQRFDSGDTKSLNTKPEVFDKEAFVAARKKSRKVVRRHSSLEPSEVGHLESSMGGVYAVVNKMPKRKTDQELSSLLSTTVMAQLTLDDTEQIGSWEKHREEPKEEGRHKTSQKSHGGERKGPHNISSPEENKKEPRKTGRQEKKNSGYVQVDLPTNHPPKSGQETKEPPRRVGHVHGEDRNLDYAELDLQQNDSHAKERKDGPKPAPRQQGYVQLAFQENKAKKGRVIPNGSPLPGNSRVDTGKTKYGYSTVVFEKEESNKELAEKKKQNKPVPQPPPKYDGSGPLSKNSSDSTLLYSDIDHGKTRQHAISRKHGDSAPDLSQSPNDKSGYVNVRFNNAPAVPPRRGVAAIQEDASQ